MLDAKARKANQGLILEARPDIIASTERRRPSSTERRSRAAPKDIESLISNNLMKLRSLSPSSKAAKATDEGSNLIYDRLDVSGPFWVKHWEGKGYFITYLSLLLEIRVLSSMKCSSESLQNFMYNYISSNFTFFPYEFSRNEK